MLHTAITDISNNAFYKDEIFIPINLLKINDNKSIVHILNNRLDFDEETNSLKFIINRRNIKINIDLMIQSIMEEEEKGIISMGNFPNDSSYYFSFPNLKTEGNIVLKVEALPVKGFTWSDHQWGYFHIKNPAWDWFSLRFNKENIFIMIFKFKRNVLEITEGNIHINSKTEKIKNIRIKVLEYYITKEGIKYPSKWIIEIFNNKDLEKSNQIMTFEVSPLMKEQHFVSYFLPNYWEGICKVEGKILRNFEKEPNIPEELNGFAYVELVGYG